MSSLRSRRLCSQGAQRPRIECPGWAPGRTAEDTLRLARQTWTGDTAAFAGKRVNAAYPLSNPLPLSRPRPRILVGGAGPTRTLPLVAKYADAWNVITSPSRIDTHRDRFREQCERVGRSMDEIEITALDPEDLRREQDAAYRWSARWEVERLGAWRERGIEHVVLNIDPHDLGKLRAFGREVIAAVA